MNNDFLLQFQTVKKLLSFPVSYDLKNLMWKEMTKGSLMFRQDVLEAIRYIDE